MFTLLAAHPLLLLALLLLLGSVVGQVKIAGAHLGPAAVLFVALGLTVWAKASGIELTVPEILGSFGLILFTYTVGIISGPNFFGSLRRGWPVMLSTIACVGVAAGVAGLIGRALGLPQAAIAGTYAGALTNTPALAAVSQATGDAELPAVGYSISYLFGVVGMMLTVAWALRRAGTASTESAKGITQATVRVDVTDRPLVRDLVARYDGSVTLTRVQHGNQPMVVAAASEAVEHGDLVSVVGPEETVSELIKDLGHASTVDLIGDRSQLDSNRVTLSTSTMAGQRLAQLQLQERFGAQVSRVRRGDVDMIPTPDFVVHLGDRLRVVAPRDQMRAIRAHLGDSERGFADINPVGLALGLCFGVLIGIIPIPLPAGTFTLGSAAGTLIAGLIFGRVGRLAKKLPIAMSSPAAHSLSALGMLIFLAYAGTKAGLLFAEAVSSSLGWRIAVLGVVVTTSAAVALVIAWRLQKTQWLQLCGQLAGAQTQPAVLAFANTRTGFATMVSLGYALVYPAAMVGKILFAQVLALVG